MAKTLAEIRDELKSLREDIFQGGESADTKMLASYLDRLLNSVDGLCEALESMESEIDTVCECCQMEAPAPKPAKAAKKPAKKPAKKSKPKKRK